MKNLSRLTPYLLSVLRIVAAFVFIAHGTQKIFGVPGHSVAVAYFIQHLPRGPWPILNGGELAVMFSFLWLFFCVAGPDPISIDALRKRA